MIRIGLDAMGGDRAPIVPVTGAVEAARELPDSCQIQLVGRQAEVEAALAQFEVPDGKISVVEASETIGMAEKPLQAIRGKRKSSIRVGLERLKAGDADAFISAGNTGAVMAGSALVLGVQQGVERPAIGALFPTQSKPVLVLDAGANIDCKPRELRGFAHIGSVYARDVLGRHNPTVGLLNIGEEEEKGNEAVRETHGLLKTDQQLNFVGNVEGTDVLRGELDVVVCDGFVGNVLLKFYETVAHLFAGFLEREIEPELLQSPGMGRVFKILDYSEYGGAPLLGVQGVTIICHGGSPARAIKNAIFVAVQAVKVHLTQHIAAEMAGDGAAA